MNQEQLIYYRNYRVQNREKLLKQQREWRERNREKEKTRRKIHYQKNRAYELARQKRYNESRIEQIANYRSKWKKENKDKVQASVQRRLAKKAGATGDATNEQISARWKMFGGKCYICNEKATATDHVKPLGKGGANWPCNLRPICGICNSIKGAKWPYNINRRD